MAKTAIKKYKRQKKSDRLLNAKLSDAEIVIDFTLGPLERMNKEADKRWGCDKLIELVSAETAAKFGMAMAKLNEQIDAQDVEGVKQWAGVCMRGIKAMEAEAEATNAPQADDTLWLIEADGHEFGLLRDDRAWPAAKEKFPNLDIVSEREMVLALVEYKQSVVKVALDAAKKHFPGAEVTKIKTKEYEDDVPF
jgi:hypothetical protein